MGLRTSYRWLALLTLLVTTASAISANDAPAPAALPGARAIEPVVVDGAFPGAPVDEVFVYRWTGSVLQQIPFQIDEVTISGAYTALEDGRLDANDEVVFAAGELGSEASIEILATLPISRTFYKVTVTDPSDALSKGFAYIVRSATLAEVSGPDAVSYNPATRTISATGYTQRYAESFAGVDQLALFGGPNVLDRSKLRVKFSPPILGNSELNEESQLLNPAAPTLLKDGRVRAILRQGSAITFAYGTYLRNVNVLDLSALPQSITLNEVRLSLDLNVSAVGGTYFDQNIAAGVAIDGQPDNVPTTPATELWRQVSLSSGSVVQVLRLSNTGGTISRYYKDDTTPDGEDTGDQQSYGDSGLVVTSPTARSITVDNHQFFLPGDQANVGGTYYAIANAPLQVTAEVFLIPSDEELLFLPVLRR